MLVVDVETSGINSSLHGLLSVGAVDLFDPERKFYGECRLWSEARIMDEALGINGFSEEDLRRPDRVTEGELIAEFGQWMQRSEDHTVAGQNPHFDVSFLEATAYRSGIDLALAHRLVDLHSVTICHMIVGGVEPPIAKRRSDLNSDSIMRYVGIPPEPRPHHALNGAVWEAEAFHRLFYSVPLFEEFEQYAVLF